MSRRFKGPKGPRKPRRMGIRHHICLPTPMLPNQAYPYCYKCGRAMSAAKKVYFPSHIGEDGRLKITVGKPKVQEPNPN